MAVTAYIDRLRNFHQAPSPEELGMGSAQIPLSAPAAAPWAGSKFIEHPDMARHYLNAIYQPLKKHYDWFRRTQRGQIKQYGRKARSRTEAYRWRGRSETHVLTSGMDDYPRGLAHAGELHLDLMSWMGFFTRTMKEIAGYIEEKEDERTFQEIEQAILENLDGKSSTN
jgi:mannosyl-oligosaccharide glucosidase